MRYNYKVVTDNLKEDIRARWSLKSNLYDLEGIKLSKTAMQKEIAKELGVSKYAVRKALLGKEIFTRLDEKTKQDIYAEHLINSVSYKQLAKKHKVSYNSVRESFYEANNRGWNSSPVKYSLESKVAKEPRTVSLPVLATGRTIPLPIVSGLESKTQESPVIAKIGPKNTKPVKAKTQEPLDYRHGKVDENGNPLNISDPRHPDYDSWNKPQLSASEQSVADYRHGKVDENGNPLNISDPRHPDYDSWNNSDLPGVQRTPAPQKPAPQEEDSFIYPLNTLSKYRGLIGTIGKVAATLVVGTIGLVSYAAHNRDSVYNPVQPKTQPRFVGEPDLSTLFVELPKIGNFNPYSVDSSRQVTSSQEYDRALKTLTAPMMSPERPLKLELETSQPKIGAQQKIKVNPEIAEIINGDPLVYSGN